MTELLTLDSLIDILRASAGDDGDVDLGATIEDTPFEDLGYDSLAILETASRVQRTYGVVLSDEQLAGADTPRLFLAAVNGQLTGPTAPAN
jgi:act minimal PKS acyl carrier protein